MFGDHGDPRCSSCTRPLRDKHCSSSEWKPNFYVRLFSVYELALKHAMPFHVSGSNWNPCKQQQWGKMLHIYFGTKLLILILEFANASLCFQVLRLNGLTLAALGQAQVRFKKQLMRFWGVQIEESVWSVAFSVQAASLLPQLVLQQQPDVLLTPQLVNLNPQLAGPFNPQGPQLFLPNQGNQLTPIVVPNGQQDQLGPPPDPNNPSVAQQGQNPVQVRHW